jgi:hypothetical protein
MGIKTYAIFGEYMLQTTVAKSGVNTMSGLAFPSF